MNNIRVLIATLSTIQRLSYTQIQKLLETLFPVTVSQGEISNILQDEARRPTPAKDALLATIHQEASQHMDETSYNVRGEKRYAWSISGGDSGNTVYEVGLSRGKGIGLSLHTGSQGVLVSDDYGAYRHMAEHHQLCYAHLIRKFRDLAQSPAFSETELLSIRQTYTDIKTIYYDIVAACLTETPLAEQSVLVTRFENIAEIQELDPKPVRRLKTTLQRNIAKYLTCLQFPTIALTNNLAERSLRHVVLKRKVSFGCASERGARAAGVLFSVLLSLFRKDPMTYFERYRELRVSEGV